MLMFEVWSPNTVTATTVADLVFLVYYKICLCMHHVHVYVYVGE